MTRVGPASSALHHTHLILGDEALRLVFGRFRTPSDPSRLRVLNQLMQGESRVQGPVEATRQEQHIPVCSCRGVRACGDFHL